MPKRPFVWLMILSCLTTNLVFNLGAIAQDSNTPNPGETRRPEGVLEKGQDIPTFELQPQIPAEDAVNKLLPKPAPGNKQYLLEFNRSPVVGNRFRLNGIYDESRLGFTRPRNWKIKSVKILLRYRQSGALYATRSNMTVRMNDTGVGSIPLTKRQDEIGTVVFDVPLHLLQDNNEITIAALQNNSPTCTQDPFDPSLWSEVMPDSKVVFEYAPQPATPDFNLYPYPVFDNLSLEGNQVAYLMPEKVSDGWLTTTTRYQTALGRIADYRPLSTRLVKSVADVNKSESLVIIGSPTEQPVIGSLTLPLPVKDKQILDKNQKPLPPDTGVLMLATTGENKTPVLVATGNSDKGVAKAVQFLVQSQDRKIGAGQSIIVRNLTNVPSPPAREWQGYLPSKEEFQLKELKNYNNKPFTDVTVRGSDAPPIEFNFRSLPDDEVKPGGTMKLWFSYGPQINPNTSLVEVQLDGIGIYGKRLTSMNGGQRDSIDLDLPAEKIKPNTKMRVNFRLDPRERRSCSRVTSQQLWATLHNDTSFKLKRTNVVQLPDLKLMQSGYPFAAPQDMSMTAVVLPDAPTPADITTLLEFSQRMGRLSKAESVKLDVFTLSKFPKELLKVRHLVGIGIFQKFPFPEVFKAEGFQLGELFSRKLKDSDIQALPDNEGVIKQIASPYRSDRVLLALTSQTYNGLAQVQDLLKRDPLFYQIEGDTALIGRNTQVVSPDSPDAYNLQTFERSPKRRIENNTNPADSFLSLLQGNWFLLAPGIIVAALILYGVVQMYLNRLADQKDKSDKEDKEDQENKEEKHEQKTQSK